MGKIFYNGEYYDEATYRAIVAKVSEMRSSNSPFLESDFKRLVGGNSAENEEYLSRIQGYLSSGVGEITSRDQIINPYDILDSTRYRFNERGQSLYDEHLNQLLALQKQQEAAFEEYYNSASQQALRESEAGRNPALSDISAGDAASADPLSGASPMESVPASADIANSITSGITSLINSSAQLAALPTSFAQAKLAGVQSQLLGSQVAGQELNNLRSFEGLIYSAAAGRFADAASSAAVTGSQFDVDKFFSDPKSFEGVFEAYAPEDLPRYRSAYNNAIKNVQKIKGEGYKLSGDAVFSQTSFAKALSDPYFDSELLCQIALMEPVMRFQEDVRILNLQFEQRLTSLKNSALQISGDTMLDRWMKEQDAALAKAQYEIDYFENFDGDESALYDMYQKKFTALRSRAVGDIYDNYWSIWKKDPLSTKGLGASYFITNGEHMKWYEFLTTFAITQPGNSNNDGKVGFETTQEIVQGTDTLSYPKRPLTIFDIPKNL